MRAAGVVRHSAEARRRPDARRRPRLASRVRRHGIPHRRLLLLLLWGCASALPALDQSASAAQSAVAALENRSWEIHAVRIDTPLDLDGRLDDEAWQRATPITEFYQRDRNEGIPATEATEVRILYDGDNLYIGWRCFDSDPSRSTHRAIFRDESAGADDLVAVMLDAYHGHRSAVQFISNANGLVFELLQNGESESTRNSDYNTVWTSKGSRNDRGFDVEMVIPFKSLRFPRQPGGQEVVFGIGFKRNIPRKNEEVTWPFVSNDSSWYRPAELGHLRGLVDIQPGHNLEVRPYALGGGLRDGAANDTTGRRDAGFDVKWGVTTGLTADFTVNTDFAQEEADVQQVNFTRFSLFFPEKRQFFLEGQQMFQFGVPREADLTFTRRIGLSPEGTIVPITAGARLSGRQGRTSIGAMTIQTRDEGDIEGQNFSVLRVRRDILSRSSIGALFTNVQDAGSANRVIGADANIYFKRVWFAEGFVARTSETGLRARGAEYGRFAYNTDRREVSYRYLAVDDGFNPGVGFVRRPDSRSHSALARWSPRPKSRLVRQYHATGTVGYITSHEQVLETRERSAQFTVDFETGDSVTMQTTNTLEFIDEPFDLRSNVTIPPGTYRFTNAQFAFTSFRRRHTTFNATYTRGGFWGGDRDTLSLRTNLRMSTHFGVSLNYDVNWVDLPQGRFTSHLASSRVLVAFRNNLALFSLFQYNRDTRLLSSNIRFNWIPKPGTDFFVVYNELDSDRHGFAMRNRSLVVKLNYLFAL